MVGVSLCTLVVRALLVGWWLVGSWLVVTYMPFSLCLGWCAWWWLPARLGGSCLGGW